MEKQVAFEKRGLGWKNLFNYFYLLQVADLWNISDYFNEHNFLE